VHCDEKSRPEYFAAWFQKVVCRDRSIVYPWNYNNDLMLPTINLCPNDCVPSDYPQGFIFQDQQLRQLKRNRKLAWVSY
jgi:hypothetical protein